MSELPDFLPATAVLPARAKGYGHLSARPGRPAIVSELPIGLVLGPPLLNLKG